MPRFLIGSRHHEYSFVPHARFTPRTSAWKKRSEVHASTPKAMKPALFREATTLSMVLRMTLASCSSSGICALTKPMTFVATSSFGPRKVEPMVMSSRISGNMAKNA